MVARFVEGLAKPAEGGGAGADGVAIERQGMKRTVTWNSKAEQRPRGDSVGDGHTELRTSVEGASSTQDTTIRTEIFSSSFTDEERERLTRDLSVCHNSRHLPELEADARWIFMAGVPRPTECYWA